MLRQDNLEIQVRCACENRELNLKKENHTEKEIHKCILVSLIGVPQCLTCEGC